ncbi:MAG: peptidoglycan-associated lipoprotein Pal [Nitrospinota bacterium]
MWRKGVLGRIPFLAIIGLAVLAVGCPKKAPQPVKPAEPAPPREAPVVRPEVPPPPSPPPQPRVTEEDDRARKVREFQEAMRAFEGELIHFDFDRSEIKDESKPVLSRKADFLRRYPNVRIQVEGHCDERGTVQYNLALGDRRANSAKAYLAALGIDGTRISTISFGEERPLNPGHNEGAWEKNRRAKFVVVGQ